MLLSALIFEVFQPYKKCSQNRSDIAFMLLMALFFIALTANIVTLHLDQQSIGYYLMVLSAVLIILFLILMFAWFIFHRILKQLFLKIMNHQQDALKHLREAREKSVPPLSSTYS